MLSNKNVVGCWLMVYGCSMTMHQCTSLWLTSRLFTTADSHNLTTLPTVQTLPQVTIICFEIWNLIFVNKSLKKAVETWLEEQSEEFYFAGIESLQQKWHEHDGHYIEKWKYVICSSLLFCTLVAKLCDHPSYFMWKLSELCPKFFKLSRCLTFSACMVHCLCNVYRVERTSALYVWIMMGMLVTPYLWQRSHYKRS